MLLVQTRHVLLLHYTMHIDTAVNNILFWECDFTPCLVILKSRDDVYKATTICSGVKAQHAEGQTQGQWFPPAGWTSGLL